MSGLMIKPLCAFWCADSATAILPEESDCWDRTTEANRSERERLGLDRDSDRDGDDAEHEECDAARRGSADGACQATHQGISRGATRG